MLNFKILILALVVSLSFLGLVGVKVYVHDVQADIAGLEANRTKLREEVQVLKAEWSNLNRPERLKSLSEQYLKFEQISNNKIRYFGDKTQANKEHEAKIMPVSNEGKSHPVNWRYKPREFIVKSKK
jgi:cell division protein FtsL